jgi:hypothetical protein
MEKTRVIVSDVYVVDPATKEETRILGEMTFGRVDADKSFPQDTLISRRHFRLVPADDVVLIEDLGSTNRTKVNGKLLKASTLYKLRSRDLIEFGQQKLQIFIGGKIVGDATKLVSREKGHETEQSVVFERFVAEPGGAAGSAAERAQQAPGEGGIIRGVEGLDIQSESDRKLEAKKDEALIQGLVQKKNAAWYLQFGGSEFGPLSLKELKVVVTSKQFQGGVLFAFTEGLADWLPVDKLQRFLEETQPEFTATQRIGSGVPLAGTVTCHLRGGKVDRYPGKIDSVSLSELTITLRDPFLADGSLFEVEAKPEAASGIEPFRATVKLDKERSLRNTHTLIFIQATPRTKMSIERYVRSFG